jgi:hypothetical protein
MTEGTATEGCCCGQTGGRRRAAKADATSLGARTEDLLCISQVAAVRAGWPRCSPEPVTVPAPEDLQKCTCVQYDHDSIDGELCKRNSLVRWVLRRIVKLILPAGSRLRNFAGRISRFSGRSPSPIARSQRLAPWQVRRRLAATASHSTSLPSRNFASYG